MIIPAVYGALMLGVAFDYKSLIRKPPLIFDEIDLSERKEIIKHPSTRSQYRITESSTDVNDFLNINGELGIKARKGDISLSGMGAYLQNTVNHEKTVEVLFTVEVQTETHTFPSYTKLRTDWQNLSPDVVGTHYIRSITYGGQLICTYRLTSTSYENTLDIKAALSANLALSGNINVNGSGKFEKMEKEVFSKAEYSATAYATVENASIYSVDTLEKIFDIVDKFPDMVGEKGSVLKIEVIPLSTLTPKQIEVKPNPSLDALLNEATDKYDDLKVAYGAFDDWYRKFHPYPRKAKKLIDEYTTELRKAMDAFDAAIINIDPAKGPEQFDEALRLYGLNEKNIPNRFYRNFETLRHTADQTQINWYPYTTAVSQYIHWGSINCTWPNPEPIYVGIAGTAPKGFGSGASIECLPATNPSLVKKPQPQDAIISYLSGVQFKLPDETGGPVLCAFCELTNATSVYMIPGANECPGETKLEYSGYLMTSKDSGTTSTLICLDMNPETNIPGVEIQADQISATISPVWMEIYDEFENEKKYLGCVVCSR